MGEEEGQAKQVHLVEKGSSPSNTFMATHFQRMRSACAVERTFRRPVIEET